MRKTILFSPIGGNDPVSSSTERDGSMLHICRHYKPDEVYLFLSKEMVERHRRDNRYSYCIQKLEEQIGHHFQIKYIEKEDLEEVQEYDFYYDEFLLILNNIQKELTKEDIILVNIASGTPAMKSALLMLAVMSEYRIQPIQVDTPEKAINVHTGKDRDYDPEYYWEINKDNEKGAKNRCVETKCPNLSLIIKKNIIVKHIDSYNYDAAFMLGMEIQKDISEDAYRLLEIAVARVQLDINKAKKISDQFAYNIFPIIDSHKIKLFEYALVLKIKMQRKDYGDFIRAISPLLTDLFEMILKEQCHINIRDYSRQDDRGVQIWDIKKLKESDQGKELLAVLNDEFKPEFKNSPVAASNLKPLLINYLTDEVLKKKIEEIREIESKIRNIAAHEIVSITEDNLSKIFGRSISMNQIFKILKSLIIAAGVRVREEDWNSYDKMNVFIEKVLEETHIYSND